MDLAEIEWLKLAREKNEEAFVHLVELYQTPVYNMCFRMLGNSMEAEDASQEAFWRAFQAIDRYDPQRSFITWLLSIAAHHCIDLSRKKRLPLLDVDLLTDLDAPDPSPTPEVEVTRRQDKEKVMEKLKELHEVDRTIVVLRYWNDMSEEEISATVSLSVPAVKSRLHRARKQLAQLWMQDESSQTSKRSIHEALVL